MSASFDLSQKPRINSIDILRGAVMLIMAIDHTRDFFHSPAAISNPLDLTTTTPAIFFTRWITHYCAPIFVFLSGVSAFISSQRRSRKEMSLFLIKRGIWLIIVELVVVSLAITFNPLYNFLILQVIWAIGWSMIILGLLIVVSYKLVFAIGLILLLGHNLLDYITLPGGAGAQVGWEILLTSPGTFRPIGGGYFLLIAYAILPWTAIMLLGYSFGKIYAVNFNQQLKRKILLGTGLGLIGLFLLLRIINQYGDPAPWQSQQDAFFTFLSFINITKYPVSLQYSCLTLGVGILALTALDHVKTKFTDFLSMYGRVPFFYYVLHFFLIHFLCVLFFFASGHGVNEIVDPQSPFLFRPRVFGWPLWVVYLVWLGVILLLYYPVKWFNRYKQTHRQWWLSYI